MREAIDNFYADKQRYPVSLNELIPHYLRSVPRDPLTNRVDWSVVRESNGPGVVDVHATAKGKTCEGTRYTQL